MTAPWADDGYCRAFHDTHAAASGFLMCDLPTGHDGPHHDPLDGGWALLLDLKPAPPRTEATP